MSRNELKAQINRAYNECRVVLYGTGGESHGIYDIGNGLAAKVYLQRKDWQKEWENMGKLHEQGILIPEPHDHVKLRLFGFPKYSNVMENIDGICLWFYEGDKRPYLELASQELRRASSLGWYLEDIAERNIIVRSSGEIVLLDFTTWVDTTSDNFSFDRIKHKSLEENLRERLRALTPG